MAAATSTSSTKTCPYPTSSTATTVGDLIRFFGTPPQRTLLRNHEAQPPWQLAAARPAMIPQLLRENVEFRRFSTGQTASLVGDQVTMLALPLTAVLVLHAGATMGT
jgi:hypothetical protein